MVQLRYFRGEKQRTDTVRLFLPDTSALMPNASEFETLQTMLRAQLTERIAQLENAPGAHEIIANKARTMEEEPQVRARPSFVVLSFLRKRTNCFGFNN